MQTGRYRHYKGGEYLVLGIVRHSETEEELVLYRALYGDRGLWVRPVTLFREWVETPNGSIPRFSLIQAETDPWDSEKSRFA